MRIKQAAIATGLLVYNAHHTIFIYENIYAAIVKKRQTFHMVKKQLRVKGIMFAMLSSKSATQRQEDKFFRHPEDVEQFLCEL